MDLFVHRELNEKKINPLMKRKQTSMDLIVHRDLDEKKIIIIHSLVDTLKSPLNQHPSTMEL